MQNLRIYLQLDAENRLPMISRERTKFWINGIMFCCSCEKQKSYDCMTKVAHRTFSSSVTTHSALGDSSCSSERGATLAIIKLVAVVTWPRFDKQ